MANSAACQPLTIANQPYLQNVVKARKAASFVKTREPIQAKKSWGSTTVLDVAAMRAHHASAMNSQMRRSNERVEGSFEEDVFGIGFPE